jgi:hypothetical protein
MMRELFSIPAIGKTGRRGDGALTNDAEEKADYAKFSREPWAPPRLSAVNYEAKWITIGGGEGPNGEKHHGGTHVMIDSDTGDVIKGGGGNIKNVRQPHPLSIGDKRKSYHDERGIRKRPHEMSSKEYEEWINDAMKGDNPLEGLEAQRSFERKAGKHKAHPAEVIHALELGHEVPDAVKKEYLDLEHHYPWASNPRNFPTHPANMSKMEFAKHVYEAIRRAPADDALRHADEDTKEAFANYYGAHHRQHVERAAGWRNPVKGLQDYPDLLDQRMKSIESGKSSMRPNIPSLGEMKDWKLEDFLDPNKLDWRQLPAGSNIRDAVVNRVFDLQSQRSAALDKAKSGGSGGIGWKHNLPVPSPAPAATAPPKPEPTVEPPAAAGAAPEPIAEKPPTDVPHVAKPEKPPEPAPTPKPTHDFDAMNDELKRAVEEEKKRRAGGTSPAPKPAPPKPQPAPTPKPTTGPAPTSSPNPKPKRTPKTQKPISATMAPGDLGAIDPASVSGMSNLDRQNLGMSLDAAEMRLANNKQKGKAVTPGLEDKLKSLRQALASPPKPAPGSGAAPPAQGSPAPATAPTAPPAPTPSPSPAKPPMTSPPQNTRDDEELTDDDKKHDEIVRQLDFLRKIDSGGGAGSFIHNEFKDPELKRRYDELSKELNDVKKRIGERHRPEREARERKEREDAARRKDEQAKRDAEREEALKKLPVKNRINGWEIITDGLHHFVRDPNTKEIVSRFNSLGMARAMAKESPPDQPAPPAAQPNPTASAPPPKPAEAAKPRQEIFPNMTWGELANVNPAHVAEMNDKQLRHIKIALRNGLEKLRIEGMTKDPAYKRLQDIRDAVDDRDDEAAIASRARMLEDRKATEARKADEAALAPPAAKPKKPASKRSAPVEPTQGHPTELSAGARYTVDKSFHDGRKWKRMTYGVGAATSIPPETPGGEEIKGFDLDIPTHPGRFKIYKDSHGGFRVFDSENADNMQRIAATSPYSIGDAIKKLSDRLTIPKKPARKKSPKKPDV